MTIKGMIRGVSATGWMLAALFLFSAGAQAEAMRIVALGDSLSAGYELPPEEAFPAQLERVLKAKGLDVVVENAGVSGDTSTGGRDRLDWSVADGTRLVIVELGANDALRGIDPALTRANLDAILARLKERGIGAVLAGMIAPPNMGADYAAAFNPIYAELAAKHGVPLYPFFLDGVAAQPGLLLSDGMHPNGAGVAKIAQGIAPIVAEALGSN
jgi:acyl-CoA thioesterase I